MRAIGAVLLLVAAGCAVRATLPEADEAEQALRRADAAVEAGAPAEATRVLHEALARMRPSPHVHRALYRLGRLLVEPANPAVDYRQAYRAFDRLVREHPGSPHAAEGRAWRELLEAYAVRGQELQRTRQELERRTQELERRTHELERRTHELETLKTLDIEAEQRLQRR